MERNVKQKSNEGDEAGRRIPSNQGEAIVGGEGSEVGMGAATALEDFHSSMMPWSRGPSLAPGSSIRGSAQKRQLSAGPSPLVGRESMLQSIHHHSDPAAPGFGSDDIAGFGSQGSRLDFGDEGFHLDLSQFDTQASSQGLDAGSQQFLGYVMAKAVEGEAMPADDGHRAVDFEQLATPGIHSRAVASQAFLHILTLATKNIVAVRQEGVEEMRPFGDISINVPLVAKD